jgi:hypothetical protein
MNGPILPGESLATVRSIPTNHTAPQTMATATAQPIRQCKVTTKSGEFMAPAHWLGQHLAVTAPADKERTFAVQRGRWVITHRGTGLQACTLETTKAAAIKFARAWDQRFALITATGTAHNWPHKEAFGRAVARINLPNVPGRATFHHNNDDDGTGTGTAGELAAAAGIPIDQAGGVLRIRWRGKFWPAPSDAELELWTLDSCCETPDGRTVEPDHPESWLRILRLV